MTLGVGVSQGVPVFENIDHGALTGLGDDDHTQYLLVDGTRAMSGNLDMGGNEITNVGDVDGVDISALNAAFTAHIGDASIHFTEASIDHDNIQNNGTNDHAAIDTHIADGTIHFTEASIDHGSIGGLVDDDHTQYLLLAGRAGGQTAIGGTAASQELGLRGTTNANLGLIRAQSPIVFDDVTPANALSPYSVQDNSTNSFTAAFIGGTYADQRQIDFNNALFIYETLSGAPNIQSLVNPAFAAFTLFNALPILRGGTSTTHNPLQALVLNAAPNFRAGTVAGTYTAPAAFGMNFAPSLTPLASGRTIAVTSISAVNVRPQWSTVAGSTANFGTIRGMHCQNPGQTVFGSSAGTEVMTAYYGVDVDAIALGSAPVVALRSAITNGVAANRMIQNLSNAPSDFGSGLIHLNDTTPIQFGNIVNSMDVSLFWNNSNSTFDMFFMNFSDSLRFSNPANTRFLLQGNAGIGSAGDEFNFACARFSMGAQTGAVGNQVGVFVAGTRAVSVGGEWSDFLLTQAGNITINAAMGLVAGWTINAPSMTLGTGSVTTGAALNIGGNPNQGTNRVGLRIISNPSGGGGVNAALWVTAGRAAFDGIVRIQVTNDAGRGAAGETGRIIFNTDDGNLNIDDGTNWILPDGSTT